jgi:hypothetical protein
MFIVTAIGYSDFYLVTIIGTIITVFLVGITILGTLTSIIEAVFIELGSQIKATYIQPRVYFVK